MNNQLLAEKINDALFGCHSGKRNEFNVQDIKELLDKHRPTIDDCCWIDEPCAEHKKRLSR